MGLSCVIGGGPSRGLARGGGGGGDGGMWDDVDDLLVAKIALGALPPKYGLRFTDAREHTDRLRLHTCFLATLSYYMLFSTTSSRFVCLLAAERACGFLLRDIINRKQGRRDMVRKKKNRVRNKLANLLVPLGAAEACCFTWKQGLGTWPVNNRYGIILRRFGQTCCITGCILRAGLCT